MLGSYADGREGAEKQQERRTKTQDKARDQPPEGGPGAWFARISRLRRPQGEDKVNAERLEMRAAGPRAVNSEQRDGDATRTGDKDWGCSSDSMMGGTLSPVLAPNTAWLIVNLSDWLSSS